ncbi:uncharacterized protein LOC110183565 [Drosophila serrata]|uniref:uncharacterized protein LOC110183565 n=1 Tax=Drosophila serrata TaxID=7274 RepID=UPI000A1D2962|nr:uncharacterized protein LOC110183565 [Drosophila serrata]
MDHNYAEIDVINDSDFTYLTNLNHYYQQQRLQSLRQSLNRNHIYCNLPVQQQEEKEREQPPPQTRSTSTSTSPWHEPKSKSKLLVLKKPKKWKLKRTLDDFVKCLIIASSSAEHVYDYDVLW